MTANFHRDHTQRDAMPDTSILYFDRATAKRVPGPKLLFHDILLMNMPQKYPPFNRFPSYFRVILILACDFYAKVVVRLMSDIQSFSFFCCLCSVFTVWFQKNYSRNVTCNFRIEAIKTP
ncbi:MAG: hypothetical protein K0S33_3614 [Bacteroidetes bacterium]|jgi:hypothetical protein|nr:hypothetical protein [Bacteroidota bacterium]